MNRLRCFLFAATVAVSSATLALAGEIQFPGKTTTKSATDGTTTPSTETIQSAWQDLATAMLSDLLLTIY